MYVESRENLMKLHQKQAKLDNTATVEAKGKPLFSYKKNKVRKMQSLDRMNLLIFHICTF